VKSDFDLIEEITAGDAAAFRVLIEKHQKHVINVIYSMTGQVQDAHDIAQEVFIKVYKNLAYFKMKAKFSTWIYRIAINETYNYIKKEKKHGFIKESERQNIKTFENIESRETQELVNKAIEKLPYKYRVVLVLKEIEDLSYKQISETLNCRIGTVESRLFRARNILKKTLLPYYKEGC